MKYIFFTVAGSVFGIVLTKSEVISWFRVHKMFTFQESHMFLIIGSAIIIGMISTYIIKSFQVKSLEGNVIEIPKKEFNKGYIIGGLIFGAGWAITGSCPGPIFAQIGAGEFPAIVTLIGAIFGTYIYALLKPKLPH